MKLFASALEASQYKLYFFVEAKSGIPHPRPFGYPS